MTTTYPADGRARDRWILSQRNRLPESGRSSLDVRRAYAYLLEDECSDTGDIVPVATIFLTNRECPWRCLMCDLWKNTLNERVPAGAIPAQIAHVLTQLPSARQIKLYNAGSFFDKQAIPVNDHAVIADQLSVFERVIVEAHPALVGGACLRWRDLLASRGVGKLEIAMGLETAEPIVLAKLNKRMTLDQFANAAEFLRCNQIALRVFILVQPPFMAPESALHWARRSLDFAFDCGASVAVLIPTRGGNGALDALAESGDFTPPTLAMLEAATDYGISLNRGRVLADLWDLERFSDCTHCYSARHARLQEMNLRQFILAPVSCSVCGA